MKTAVIYARYSSDSQTEQSIEGQLRICKEYAEKNDIIIVDTYIDRAMTGTNDNRPDFQRMMKDSNKKEWDYVLVYKLDRFSRDKYASVIHKRTLKNNGIKLISAMENIPDTPEGIILESLLEGMNQYYSAELSQKINRGIKESWIKGHSTGGLRIYGYNVVDKKYVINEFEAETLREIFTMYARGFKMKYIADTLNAQNKIRPNGKAFDNKYVGFLLHKKIYTGVVEHNGVLYDNIFPQIISQTLWEDVKRITDENKQSPSRKKEIYDYILSGKLFCGECKHRMTGESGTSKTKKIHYYYICKSRRFRNINCKTKAVKKEELEDLVISRTTQLLKQDGNISIIAQKVYDFYEKAKRENATLKFLESKKTDALTASKNLVKAIEQGLIFETTKSRLAELEKEITDLDIRIMKEKQKECYNLSLKEIEEYLQSKIFRDTENISTRKLIVNTFIRQIFLYDDRIVITFNSHDKNSNEYLKHEEILKTEKQIKTALSSSQSLSIGHYSPPY